jgi:hypothetical protein
MKPIYFLALVATLVLNTNAFAATSLFRSYSGEIKVASGETKSIELTVDTEIHEHQLGDSKIPDHGFVRHYVEVQVREGAVTCSRALYLEDGYLSLCSGASLQLVADRLLGDEIVKASMIVQGFNRPLGEAILKLDSVQDGVHAGAIDEIN